MKSCMTGRKVKPMRLWTEFNISDLNGARRRPLPVFLIGMSNGEFIRVMANSAEAAVRCAWLSREGKIHPVNVEMEV